MPPFTVRFLLAVLTLAGLGFARAEPPVRTDAVGDPLPNDAVLRLGSGRFRLDAYTTSPALSPDGKLIAVVGRGSRQPGVRLLDAGTGQEVKRLADGGPGGAGMEIVVFSPDGQMLATAARYGGRGIQVFEVGSGNLAHTLILAAGTQEIGSLRFSADAKVLVGGGGYSGRNGGTAWEVATGKELGRFALPADEMLGLAMSPDGKFVAGWGRKAGVVLWEAAGGKEVHKLSLAETPGRFATQAAFSPDGKHLAMVESSGISVWDTAAGKQVFRSAARPGITLLAYSPDGKILAAADPGAVQVWDALTGKRLGLHPGLPGPPSSLVFAEDKLLALGLTGQALWLRDVKAGQLLSPAGGHVFPVRSLLFTPDGKSLLTGSTDGVLVWDLQTGKSLRRIEARESEADRLRGLAGRFRSYQLCPDGKRLLVSSDVNMGLSVVDAASGEVEFVLGQQGFEFRRNQALAVSADGALLAALPEQHRRTGAVQLWDLSSGQPLNPLKTKNEEPYGLALTPDGKTVAVASAAQVGGQPNAGLVQLWDVATGKERLAIPLGDRGASSMAFAPDGLLLATAGHVRGGGEVILWNTATGREFVRLPCSPGVGSNVAFSSDGRALALMVWTNQPEGMKLLVFETASGTLRREFSMSGVYIGVPLVLAFSPDGRTLASGAADTTVTLWDVGGRLTASGQEKPAESDWETLWAALDESDAVQAYPAMARMLTAPNEAVAFLATKVRPAEGDAVDEKTIDRFIRDLDSDDFATRVKATKDLAAIGGTAKAALEKVLQSQPPPEQRRRIEELLNKLIEAGPKRDRLRPTRALEVLEWLATPEARELLKVLSEGQPDAAQTREAKTALARLAAR